MSWPIGWLKENPRVRALHQPRNLGIAAAYERALDEAKLDRFSFLAATARSTAGPVQDILAAVGRADIVAPYPRTRGPPAPPPLPDLGLHQAGERALRSPDALLPGTVHLSDRAGPCAPQDGGRVPTS